MLWLYESRGNVGNNSLLLTPELETLIRIVHQKYTLLCSLKVNRYFKLKTLHNPRMNTIKSLPKKLIFCSANSPVYSFFLCCLPIYLDVIHLA